MWCRIIDLRLVGARTLGDPVLGKWTISKKRVFISMENGFLGCVLCHYEKIATSGFF